MELEQVDRAEKVEIDLGAGLVGARPFSLHPELRLRRVRRRADALQFARGAPVAAGTRFVEDAAVVERFGFALVDHLAGADVGVEKVRALLGHVHAKNRTPREAHDDDLLFVQPLVQKLGHLDAVLRHLLDGDAGRERAGAAQVCWRRAGPIARA